jgi:2-phospho-L-lactate guanylyltransferase
VTLGRTGVVIPIRAFALGKARLAAELDTSERAALGRRLAGQVVDAASEFVVSVVSSDADVRAWASERGITTIDDPGSLDASARAGREWSSAHGCTRVVIAHADLPFARSFAALAHDGAREIAVLVPCHRDDGTPVLSVPVHAPFEFQYGAGSFRRHAAEARRLGLGLRVVRDPTLSFDIDLPDDLARLALEEVG